MQSVFMNRPIKILNVGTVLIKIKIVEKRKEKRNEMKLRMGSGVVVSLCCSTTTTTTPLFISSSYSAQLRLKSSSYLGARVCCHMAHAASSNTTPSPSPSSAIDFLSICHRLKVKT